MTITATFPQQKKAGFRRITRHPALMEYWRLFALSIAANLAFLAYAIDSSLLIDAGSFNLPLLADAALVNFAAGILIRQQRIINFLFWFATRIPTGWPLWIRWGAGKVFHFGGLHTSANVAGTIWFALLLAGFGWEAYQGTAMVSDLTLWTAVALVSLLAAMIITALAPIRMRFHDLFEQTHRFAGWTALALFWVQTASFTHDQGAVLFETPAFWMLAVITLSILSPWLSLKKVPVEVVKPSNHAVVVKFNYGDNAFPGSSNAISLDPLREWHSFASIPTPGEDGYRLIISRAGDWTGSFIDNPPSHVWVKGITTSGVARIETLFKSVVYVATGSGIGPVLPHLLADDVPIRLIWATRSPRKTYGDALVDEILKASPDAVIWDTDANGKPDLSELALREVADFGAEAVICISNQKLTRRVIHDVEAEGIPGYGAIWDS